MKPVRTRLKEYKRLASDSEKELIEYIQNHMDQVVKMSVHELAKEAYTSASTVIRLVKKIGFKGFKEFKQDLIAEITLRESTKIPEQNELTKEEKSKDIIDKITYRHIISIEETKSLIDLEVFETCIKLLTQAEQIYIFGIGASFLAAKDLQQKMMRVGKLSLAFEDYHLQILQARNMKPHDLAIVF
ncbi:MAG: MurR/RpiR family transcriptional regulator, partial [Niameybacter sp.]